MGGERELVAWGDWHHAIGGTFQRFTKPSVRHRCPLRSDVVGGRSRTGRHCRVTTMTLEGSQSDAEQPHIRVKAGQATHRTTAWSPGTDNHGEAAISHYRERGPRSVCSDGDVDQSPVSGFDRRIIEAGDTPRIWRTLATILAQAEPSGYLRWTQVVQIFREKGYVSTLARRGLSRFQEGFQWDGHSA